MLTANTTVEIVIHGRGGQAALTTGNLLTYALFLEGLEPHGQPRFTPDRMGAPVSYAIRFNRDRSPIVDRSWVSDPQIVLLFDLSLVVQLDLARAWSAGIDVIANMPPSAPMPKSLSPFRLHVLDANRIARECGLMKGCVPILSSAMAGAFCKVTRLISLQNIEAAMAANMKGSLARYMDANLTALHRGYQEVHGLEDE